MTPGVQPARPEDSVLSSLLVQSQELGFLGPGPVDAHVRHASGFLSVVGEPDCLLDLGSGGGLPGLVLAQALPTTQLVLLDAMERRCRFLERAALELGIDDRVTVECGRAEELARRVDLRGRFPIVVTRSFGAPSVTAECAVGFLRPDGGRLIVSEPPEHEADRWPELGLAQLGLAALERAAGDGWTMQVLRLDGHVDDRFPRRTGVPTKRPLF
jgi:16S rRNA (guanine527-N7)-methyltransferase